MSLEKFELEWGGRKLILETGKVAKQATSSVIAQYGETVVLATVTMAREPRESIDYFPLLVDYEERLYAAGKIKGSRFIKREGRPPDEAILTSRMIDRCLRPLFPKELRNDVQVILTVLSTDQENDPDIVSLVAASAALAISEIPWKGPIGGIRIGFIPSANPTSAEREGEWVLNPTYEARSKSILDLVIAGTPDRVVMIEAGASEVSEKTILEAFKFGQKHLKKALKMIEEMQKKIKGRVGPEEYKVTEKEKEESAEEPTVSKQELIQKMEEFLNGKLPIYLFEAPKDTKLSRKQALETLKEHLDEYLKAENIGKERRKLAQSFFMDYAEKAVVQAILDKENRVDGRKLDEVRPLSMEIGSLPRTHGSTLFNRGETQILSIVTLGGPSEEQLFESIEGDGKKRYMHHYNFPPFSVGEVSPLRFVSRREIGHGSLAEKALLPLLPDKESFPYTIRVVSEVLGSNGSSSMASVCGSSLALMDAGVPIKKACAGVAMGLASEVDKTGKIIRYKIITDIQDLEDGIGGMDFKVAGTKDGITAIQMDTKTLGLTFDIIEDTFKQAKKGRLDILKAMDKVIPEPRVDLSSYAPRIISFKINPEKIREVIGPGGKVINEIIDKTGVAIDIEDDGLVMITSVGPEPAQKAKEWIENLVREVEVGEIFQGKVTRIMDFGAFVEVLPKQEGLVHISELAPYRVNRVEDIVKEGQAVTVKVIEIDEKGRINLSIKRAQPGYKPSEQFNRPKDRFERPKGRFQTKGPFRKRDRRNN